jgi:hypothetical protein
LLRWLSGQLYIHPAKRSRQVGYLWLLLGVACFAAYIPLHVFTHYPWVPFLAWSPVAFWGEFLIRTGWAAGWEARDKVGRK